MKPAVAVLAMLQFALTPPLFAESQLEREHKALKEQHDKDIALAAEPINRRYRAALEQLLRRATQGNALDTALKIKEELKQLEGSNPSPSGLKRLFESSVWGFHNDGTFGGPPNPKITFKAGGKVSTEPPVEWITGWEVTGNQLKLFQRNRNLYWIFDVDPSGKRAVSDPARGTFPKSDR